MPKASRGGAPRDRDAALRSPRVLDPQIYLPPDLQPQPQLQQLQPQAYTNPPSQANTNPQSHPLSNPHSNPHSNPYSNPPPQATPIPQPQSHLAPTTSRRTLSHPPTEWLKIQPRLTQLYVDLDMTLRESMIQIGKEFGFYASEQMYKKRIKAWNLSKHVKAQEKDNLIAKLVQGTSGSSSIRHDKLIRHAKSRVKSGSLTYSSLKKVQTSTKSETSMSKSRPGESVLDLRDPVSPPLFDPALKRPMLNALKHSPFLSPAQPLAKFELFLKSMQAVVRKEHSEWLAGQQQAPDTIFLGLVKGISHWRNSESAAARAFFAQAAQNFDQDLHKPSVAVSRITYCVSSIVWGSIRELIFLQFAQFMANAATETLGRHSPLTIILRQLQEQQSIDEQIAIWACALDGYAISKESNSQTVEHWYNMEQRRWRWCQSSGLHDLAVRHRDEALMELRQIDGLTVEREMQAQQGFETGEPIDSLTDPT